MDLECKFIFYNYVFLDSRKPGRYSYDGLDVCFLYEPFYVGKGTGYRKFAHLTPSSLKSRSRKNNKIKKILSDGGNVRNFILQINSCVSESHALNMENLSISLIGRIDNGVGPLTNHTDGNDGVVGYSSPFKGQSDVERYGAEKAAIRSRNQSILMQTNNPRTGVKLTEETKNKISNSHLGKKKSSETRRKISDHYSGGSAANWCMISPTGERFEFKGSFKSFTENKGLPLTTSRGFIDKGIIPPPHESRGPRRDALTGWEIIKLSL